MSFLVAQNRKRADRRVLFKRARTTFKMRFEFCAELLHESLDRHRRSVAKRTERSSKHVVSQVFHIVNVFCDAATVVETRQSLGKPVGSFAARNAPSTAFMAIELDRAQRELHDAGVIIKDDDSAGAKER